jgi:hypothetical protein
VLYIAGVFYYGQIAQIKANWPLYRCNPMYMYLADDIESNFVFCIQNMQTGFMGYLLQPLTYVTSSISGMLGGFLGEINMVRAMFDKIRTFFESISKEIMGRIMNIMVPLQQIIISFKDLIGKIQGTMTAGLFTVNVEQQGLDVVWSGSGSFNLGALSFEGDLPISSSFNSSSGTWVVGPETTVDEYGGASLTYPTSFGSSGTFGTPAASGSTFGIIPGGAS